MLVRVYQAGRPLMKHEIAEAMAEEWEASPRTLLRDVDWLVAHGLLERVGEKEFRYPVGRWPAARLTAEEWRWVNRVMRAVAGVHPENGRIQKALHILETALRWNGPPEDKAEVAEGRTLLVRGWDLVRSAEETPKRQRLEELLRQGRGITFRYHPATPPPGLHQVPPEGLQVDVDPSGLLYWGELDGWYLVAIPHQDQAAGQTAAGRDPSSSVQLFRLDRLEDPEPTLRRTEPAADLTQLLSAVWGAELGEPVQVAVRFRGLPYVQEKVERVARTRSGARLEQTASGDLIYTDVVAGWGEFSRWVRQFGRAARVLHPPVLAAMVEATAQAWLEMYQRPPEPLDEVLAFAEEATATVLEDGRRRQGRESAVRGAEPAALLPPHDRGRTRLLFLLQLLRYLATHPGKTAAEAAAALGVSEGGVLRTLFRLLEAHYARIPLVMDPPEAEGHARRAARWSLMEGFQIPPVELEAWDLLGLARALELFQDDPKIQPVLGMLRRSLEPWVGEYLPQALFRFVRGRVALFETGIEAELVATLEEAVRCRREVQLVYPADRDSTRSWLLRPLAVVFSWDPGAWYMVAWPILGAEPEEVVFWQGVPLVHLRLDRMRQVQVRSTVFEVPPEFNLEAYLEPIWGMEAGTEPVRVVVRFADEANVVAKARRHTAHRRRARWIPLADGSAVYVDWVVGENEFLRWVRGFGRSAEILVPTSWRARMLQTAQGMLDAPQNGPGGAPPSMLPDGS